MDDELNRLTTRPATRRTGWRWRRVILLTLGVFAIGFVLLIVAASYIRARLPRKEDAFHASRRPGAATAPATPILQFETHTCGLLALSAAYRTCGLDPAEENLRLRLGVDVPAHPFDAGSTGTLHPDLFRVLRQDGFSYRILDPKSTATSNELCAAFAANDLALLLIVRSETGNLHWVLSDACIVDDLRIVDSLQPAPYLKLREEYLANDVVSMIIIAAGGEPDPEFKDAYADGAAEMLRVRERLKSARRP